MEKFETFWAKMGAKNKKNGFTSSDLGNGGGDSGVTNANKIFNIYNLSGPAYSLSSVRENDFQYFGTFPPK